MTPPKKRRAALSTVRPKATPGRCNEYAPCGDQCALGNHVKHELHCCRHAECQYCHGRERYEKVTK